MFASGWERQDIKSTNKQIKEEEMSNVRMTDPTHERERLTRQKDTGGMIGDGARGEHLGRGDTWQSSEKKSSSWGFSCVVLPGSREPFPRERMEETAGPEIVQSLAKEN